MTHESENGFIERPSLRQSWLIRIYHHLTILLEEPWKGGALQAAEKLPGASISTIATTPALGAPPLLN